MLKPTTLYSPDGRKYSTSDRVEITRLKAHGYSEKAPRRAAAKSDASKASDSK